MKLILWKLSKYLLIFVIVFVVFVLGYLFFAWLLSYFTTHPKKVSCANKKTVYASSNGVHMDLIMHRDLIDADFLAQLNNIEGREYIAIGWGDKGFYLYTPSWAELKVSTALIAGFLPSETIMHVTHYQSVDAKWKTIELCDSQLKEMKKFIADSFKKDAVNRIQILEGAGFSENDFFYQAHGNYTCLYTCNIWVNQALKKAQVRTALWSPFDKGIMRHL